MESKKNYFDDIIENDQKGNFLITSSEKCFNHCIPKITTGNITTEEKSCFLDCYTKQYYSYTQATDILNLNK